MYYILFYIYHFPTIITRMVDKECEKGNFKVGEICYLSYEPRSAKTADTYESTSIYYFSIDGLKGTNTARPYFPFKKKFQNFIKKMDIKKCYKAEYLEVNILFYKQRRIYQLLDFND